MNRYDFGNSVQLQGAFRDGDGVLYDPSAVKISYRDGANTLTTKVYGVDEEIVQVSTGIYTINVFANHAGTWYYRWFSDTSGAEVAIDKKFYVSDTPAD
mgnify:CR=1 FL=1